MANRPANAGSGRGLAPMGNVTPPPDAAAPPPPVHHDARPPVHHDARPPVHHDASPAGFPGNGAFPGPGASRPAAGHRAARPREPGSHGDREDGGRAWDREDPGAPGLAWVPYLIVLAGAAAGMFVIWQGSKYAARGTGLLGCSLLAAGLARLVLPPRLASLLSTRRKASDVLAFAVFGAAVLAVALMLP
jgi:hypothetical protein